MLKKVFITGVSGQDGSYLSELLLNKSYEVHGLVRYKSDYSLKNLNESLKNPNFFLHYGDLQDFNRINDLIKTIQPDEIYNLAAQSHVKVSFELPIYTSQVTGLATLNILEAIRQTNLGIKFYQASSSEMFGKVHQVPQNENTPFYPRSPYGCAKVFSYWITKNYRESYGIFAVNGILFNHESERRGENFVTKKIISKLTEIKMKGEGLLKIGNLEARRDWGYAPEYTEGMWRMLQAVEPNDYVLATNETHSIRELVLETADYLEMKIEFHGKGVNEVGIWNNIKIIEIDPNFFRPSEVDLLIGDYSKAKNLLNWEPKTKFKELIKLITDFELKKYEL
jgi:GDPmannose 4,6-dehydratase